MPKHIMVSFTIQSRPWAAPDTGVHNELEMFHASDGEDGTLWHLRDVPEERFTVTGKTYMKAIFNWLALRLAEEDEDSADAHKGRDCEEENRIMYDALVKLEDGYNEGVDRPGVIESNINLIVMSALRSVRNIRAGRKSYDNGTEGGEE